MKDAVALPKPIAGAIDSLRNETQILDRLLYRNRNQHGKTELFHLLRPVKKALADILQDALVERILQDNGSTTNSIEKLALCEKKNGIRAETIDKISLHLSSMIILLNRCSEIYFWGHRAVVCLRERLCAKVFIPLYTVLLALMARVLRCNCTLLVELEKRWSLLENQLQVIIVDANELN